jgi:AraC-like DNA-binding protein
MILKRDPLMGVSRPYRHGIAAFWVKGVVEALAAEGLDVVSLLRDADLDLAALSDPDARVSGAKVDHLWRLAVARSGDAGVGLRGAAIPRPGIFDIVGYAMMSATDLRRVLDRAMRYMHIASGAVSLTSCDDDDGYRLCLRIEDDEIETPWQRYAFDLLSLLSFLRWILGVDLRPMALGLTSNVNEGLDLCRNVFGCPVRLGTTINCLLFSYDDVGRTIPTAHTRLASAHEQIADEYLTRLNAPLTSARARSVILQCLPDGEPRREIVARAMGMSERTLQRRLHGEGSSFQQLLDDIRKELAEKYIARGETSLAEAAYLLGFEDQGSFFRAAKRWFGTTPRAYRRHLSSKMAVGDS